MCVLVWDQVHWLGQKQNTQNLYLQADDKRCRFSLFPIESRPLSLPSLVAHEDVCDGDLEAEVAVPAAVELDVAEALVEVEEAQHPLGRHHVLLVHHHHEVAAADVGEVVLPPLLVLLLCG